MIDDRWIQRKQSSGHMPDNNPSWFGYYFFENEKDAAHLPKPETRK